MAVTRDSAWFLLTFEEDNVSTAFGELSRSGEARWSAADDQDVTMCHCSCRSLTDIVFSSNHSLIDPPQ